MNIQTYKKIICGCLLSLGIISCSDYLDREDTSGIITPDLVWTDPNATNAVLAKLYDAVRFDDFNDWYDTDWMLMNPATLSDEAQGSYQKEPMFDNPNSNYVYDDYLFEDRLVDRYLHIRRANDFLIQLEEADVLSNEKKDLINAEVRFIRAMHYFGLVKRYGGVPLLKESQEYTPGNMENLYKARDTEEAVYSFIIEECKDLARVLPVTRSNSEKYQATRGAALALHSRAALYAGSIAKYGTVKLNGLVGIPAAKANDFFTECYNASNEILQMNYSLYDANADKVQNFYDLFSKTLNGDNGEYIFQRSYNVSGGRGHDWDKRNAPFSFAGGWGCGMAPTLEMVEAFEYIDNRDGKLNLYEADGVTPPPF
ncbi:MAG: RagB/SusD family nutrient uptake outer membrane protein [Tannerellaceae bacterium]|nr:RagB/SusD family nutrient uptake outer membrane protein [Tannerellaceae bacterium]